MPPPQGLNEQQVQAMIDASIAPLKSQLADHEQRLDELEAAPTPEPPDPEPGYPSGAPITTDVPSGWREVINEHFDVDCVASQFDAIYGARRITHYPSNYPDTRTNQGKSDGGYYNAPIWVEGSILMCRMWVENGKARCMSLVPRATDDGKWGDSPGLIWEERSRFTFSDGFKAAHLSWPKSNDSTPDGEIDFPEFDRDDAVKAFLHHQGAEQNNDQKEFVTDSYPDEWHTYRTVWKMGEYVEFSIDGQLIAPRYTNRIPSTPMHLSLQNETWLRSDPVPANAEGIIETDWIRVFVPL